MRADEGNPAVALRRLLVGYRLSQALFVATKLGIADLLADGPRTVGDLAAASGAHVSALHRVLRLLASEGVFIELEPGLFGLTELATPLRQDAPISLYHRAIYDAEEWNWRAWGNLQHAVETGEPAFDYTLGMSFFDYLQQNGTAAARFSQLMAEQTLPAARAIIEAYDFSGVSTLVDVGGGYGVLLSTILSAYPHMRGVLYDQADVIEEAQARLAADGVADRCTSVAGSFFDSVPAGGDMYVLKYILHDWDDERCVTILRSCRRAIVPNGRILVAEMLIPPGNTPHFGRYLDLNMMVLLSGRERTEQEYRKLFETAGFTLNRVVGTQSELSLIEGIPV